MDSYVASTGPVANRTLLTFSVNFWAQFQLPRTRSIDFFYNGSLEHCLTVSKSRTIVDVLSCRIEKSLYLFCFKSVIKLYVARFFSTFSIKELFALTMIILSSNEFWDVYNGSWIKFFEVKIAKSDEDGNSQPSDEGELGPNEYPVVFKVGSAFFVFCSSLHLASRG